MNEESEITKGTMNVGVKTERGVTLSKKYGFTIEEDHGKVLAFDTFNHPELGHTLLFGDQVFVLKFWDDADLEKGLALMQGALSYELARRESSDETS
jgi:hypothetical protein